MHKHAQLLLLHVLELTNYIYVDTHIQNNVAIRNYKIMAMNCINFSYP